MAIKQVSRNSTKRVYNYYKKLRLAVIAFLGGKCVRCGFSDVRALQLDHINGNGHRELKQLWNTGYKASWYKSILEGKRPDVQLLCANCNWIKRVENKEYN